MIITLIHGQQHKGSTYNISQQLLENIKNENDIVHEFFMIKDNPGFCVGCFNCIERGENLCPGHEKVNEIVSAMLESQLLIIDSPTYCTEMTGQLKTFFDHLGFMWLSHRPKKAMFKKAAVAISTTAGIGARKTAKSIANQLFWIGVPKTFLYGQSVKASSWKAVSEKNKLKIAKKCKKLAGAVKRKIGIVKPGIKLRFMFNIMKLMQKNNTWNEIDKNYWKEKGWLKS